MSDGFRPRILVLPIAAAIILALVVFRLNRPPQPRPTFVEQVVYRRAPLFDAMDQQTRLVRFERYIGRHRILVVFVDKSITEDPQLRMVIENQDKLKQQGIQIIAVTSDIPQRNRQLIKEANLEIHFPVISDPGDSDPKSPTAGSGFFIHRMWGRFNAFDKQPMPGVFDVDRAGNITWSGNRPKPVSDPDSVILKVIEG